MLQDIVEAVPLEGYRLKLRFEDGVEGVIDVARCVRFTGVFAPLRERTEFAAVQVSRDLGTVAGLAALTWIQMSCMPSSLDHLCRFRARPANDGAPLQRADRRVSESQAEIACRDSSGRYHVIHKSWHVCW